MPWLARTTSTRSIRPRSATTALGHAEADRQVLEIGRRSHHDDVRASVVDERDRHLFGDVAEADVAPRPSSRMNVARCATARA